MHSRGVDLHLPPVQHVGLTRRRSRSALRALRKWLRPAQQFETDAFSSQTAAALANMLDENKEEKVLKEACVRLCQLFGEGIQNDRIQAILEANVVPKLVALLRPSRARAVPISVQAAALQVLGNVACGDDRQTQVVIDSDALPCLRALLASADRGIRKEVCWIVSNITESSHQVQDVLDADILPPLLKLLDSQDAACREDATWVLFNLSSNREPKQIAYLADKNGVRALCNLLTCAKDLDVLWKGCGTVAAVALKGLRNILICGQSEANGHPLGYNRMAALVADAHGVERIEALTQHASHDVRLRARLLLERMFGAEPSTVDLQPVSASATASSSSTSSSIAPSPSVAQPNCNCDDPRTSPVAQIQSYSHYPPPTFDPPAPSAASSLSTDQNGLPLESGSTSSSTTDSDPEDEDSDSDLIPPAPQPCQCTLCTDRLPLPERRPRCKPCDDDSDTRQICDFCQGSGRLGDGRAGLAAKLGRAVRLGHSHCLAVLLSRMTWSQRNAATDAPALLHPGGGPPAGGYGSNMPAIALAAQLGKPRCLELLLTRCMPDLKQTYGKKRYTLLAWAAMKGYVRCTQLLIEYGADPATRCADGYTALHLAASSAGNTAICKLLLGEKRDAHTSAQPQPQPPPTTPCAHVNAKTEKKQTPLCLAAQKGNWKIVQLLLQHGANPNNEDAEKYTPVHLAASNGFVDCLNLLLKAEAIVDGKTLKGVTPLHFAVQGGHASCVRLLINAGAKVNCSKKPLLLIAADEGKPEVVQILLDALATIDCKAYVKAYLDKENEISDHLTPLHLAASKGNNEVVDLLLRRGANVDSSTDNSKWTALDFAVLNGHSQCAICLLKHGATVSENCKNIGRNNWTLVQYAAQQGAKEVVRLLVQRLKEQRMKAKGAAVNKFDPNTTEFPPPAPAPELMSAPLAAAPDSLPFPAPGSTSSSHTTPVNVQNLRPSANHNLTYDHATHPPFPPPQTEEYRAPPVESTPEPPTTRRRAQKEDREAQRRQRDLKKREEEAAEARCRLDDAISQRSIAKLTEAISHVSKLVLHLATSTTTDPLAAPPPAPHGTHPTDYAPHLHGSQAHPHPDDYAATAAHMPFDTTHPPSTPSANGTTTPATGFTSPGGTPLPVEVGLGNEVMKARKMLAELQGEERRQRDERAREAADNKRDTAQQSVLKAMASTLQGGDSRILVRTVNRALRTILDSDDPVILEAKAVSQKIEALEKAEDEMSTGKRDRNLEKLTRVVPLVEEGLEEVRNINGAGAAERIFGPSGPEVAIQAAKKLCEELAQERQAAEEQRAKAQDRERQAKDMLSDAMSSHDLKRMETAIEDAGNAVLSKDSELSGAIDAAKKQFAKILKGERRKLRQANASNDADTIDAAVEAASNKGLKSLDADIKGAREKAQRLRDQKQAKVDLEDAVAEADVARLTELRTRLKDLGMFVEEERARAELDTLQRAARARTLLESAISDAKENIDAYKRKKGKDKDWKWPDTQRLHDLTERSRKYGVSMAKLCDSAVDLLKSLAVTGREVLRTSISSDDATVIAASISGYEKSFMTPTCSSVFGKDAGMRMLADARKKFAQVQAADQAKVRAEARQVKQNFAMASSRRHNVKSRTARKERKDKEVVVSKDVKEPQSATGNGVGRVEPVVAARGAESNNSSEYGGDDEASDADAVPPRERKAMARRPRAPPPAVSVPIAPPVAVAQVPVVSQAPMTPIGSIASRIRTVDELIAGELGARSIGGNADCAHYYLWKEGNTVVCAHCGNMRVTHNAEWLARVKQRAPALGSSVPPSTPLSPPHAAGIIRPPVHFAPARAPPVIPYPAPLRRKQPTSYPMVRSQHMHTPTHAPTRTHGHYAPAMMYVTQPHQLRFGGDTREPRLHTAHAAAATAAPPAAASHFEEDLGVEFASQNFGFDIDAIVDDNPPPPPVPRGKRAQFY